MSITRLYELQRYVKASAARANLNVRFEGNVPKTDGKTIFLPVIGHRLTEQQMRDIMYTVDHEVAHVRHSDFDLIVDGTRSVIECNLANAFEDIRIDHKEAEEFRGFDDVCRDFYPAKLGDIVNNCKTRPELLGRKENLMLVAALGVSLSQSPEGYKNSIGDDLLAQIPEPLRSKLYKFVTDRPRMAETCAETFEYAQDLMRLFDMDPQEEAKKNPVNSEGGNGKKGKGEKGEGEGEGEGSKSKKGDTGGKGGDPKEGQPDDEVVMTEAIDNTGKKGTPHGMNATPPPRHGEFKPKGLDKIPVVNPLEPNKFTNTNADRMHLIEADKVEGFAQKVRRALQILSRDRYEYGVKKGKLDQSRLSRIAVPVPGFSERIFKKKIVNDTLDTAVTVLLDCSGSMSGRKWTHAATAAVLLNRTISKALGVPMEILAFTDDYDWSDKGNSVIFNIKGFNDKRSDDDVIQACSNIQAAMSGNADGEAILVAHDRLIRRREKRKVLIVLSDGQPACSAPGDIDGFTRAVIKDIESQKRVDIFGLGLLSNAVTQYYTHHAIVNNSDELEHKLLELVAKKLS
jgi:hypothetical protein